MSNTSFYFRHTFLLSACSSQSHTTCLSLMSHQQVNNKCSRIKRCCRRWLIYALCIFYYVLSEATTTFLESFTNSTGFFSLPDNLC